MSKTPEQAAQALLNSLFDLPNRTACINCGRGRPVRDTGLCKRCLDASDRMEALLKEGITLEYRDGTKEIIRTPKAADE